MAGDHEGSADEEPEEELPHSGEEMEVDPGAGGDSCRPESRSQSEPMFDSDTEIDMGDVIMKAEELVREKEEDQEAEKLVAVRTEIDLAREAGLITKNDSDLEQEVLQEIADEPAEDEDAKKLEVEEVSFPVLSCCLLLSFTCYVCIIYNCSVLCFLVLLDICQGRGEYPCHCSRSVLSGTTPHNQNFGTTFSETV